MQTATGGIDLARYRLEREAGLYRQGLYLQALEAGTALGELWA